MFSLLTYHAAVYAADECFPAVDEFLAKSYGDDYRDDENISVHLEKFGEKEFIVVADKTSGTNYARNLLIEKSHNRFCLVLRTPPVAQLTTSIVDAHEFPNIVATDQAPPDLPGHEITYFFNVDRFRYDATVCREISHYQKTVRAKTVSCSAFLEQ